MKKIPYRSAGLPAGIFNQIGTCHVHIDGAKSVDLVLGIVKELELCGNSGTLDYVEDSIGGPQRDLMPEVYNSHTPMLEGSESFDFFSTSLVQGRSDAVSVINLIGDRLWPSQGIIVELEQTHGWLDQNGWQTIKPRQAIKPIHPSEVRFPPAPTKAFEIHHGFELPKTSGRPPLSLEELKSFCEHQAIMFGGWFLFEDQGSWGYWSNAFFPGRGLTRLVEEQHSKLQRFFHRYQGSGCALVERVLGIWKSEA